MNAHLLRFDKTKKITIFDFETFNLNLSFNFNRPWQTGMLSFRGDEILKESEFWIKWEECDLKISPEAAAVTRFNQAEFDSRAVFSKNCFNPIYEEIESSDIIMGHNILGFDIFLIKGWWEANNKPWEHLVDKLIDTNCLARGLEMGNFYKQGENLLEYQYRTLAKKVKGIKTNLTAYGKKLNIDHDYDSLHEALSDVRLNYKVWQKIKYMVEL